ncbi:hypothetical protein Taro_016175 [Colocasia esculenta]|uniref:Uncharacterized protein n=1 Tax=Colocasia esculenta TaxID=4460 RepID=A0A843US82_COLES|nr:hypothetical protein [Colocasia esculenta]
MCGSEGEGRGEEEAARGVGDAVSAALRLGAAAPGNANDAKKGATPQLANHVRSSNQATTTVNVNDEYKKALRTRSYIDVWTRIRRHLPRRSSTVTTPRSQPPNASPNQEQQDVLTASTCTTPLTVTSTTSTAPSASSSPFSSYSHLPDYLLEPCNEVASLLGSLRDPGLHDLFLDYFDSTLKACSICGSLLGSIDVLRRERRTIRRLILVPTATSGVDITGLASYVELENPLSSMATAQFRRVQDIYESLIRRLVLARDKVLRKARLVRILKRASAVTLVAASAALATAFLVVGGHAVAVLAVAGGPALVGPFSAWVRKRRRRRCARTGRLARLGLQLDAAARGAYIMSRDLETMSRMVARLHDEVEHAKEVVRLFLHSGEGWVHRELAQRLAGGDYGDGFSEQLDELEEHVYWCLLTINRIRRLVARELILDVDQASSPPEPATSSSGSSMHAG